MQMLAEGGTGRQGPPIICTMIRWTLDEAVKCKTWRSPCSGTSCTLPRSARPALGSDSEPACLGRHAGLSACRTKAQRIFKGGIRFGKGRLNILEIILVTNYIKLFVILHCIIARLLLHNYYYYYCCYCFADVITAETCTCNLLYYLI